MLVISEGNSSYDQCDFEEDEQTNAKKKSSSIENIEIHKTVRILDDRSFINCKQLKNVSFPNNSLLEFIGL